MKANPFRKLDMEFITHYSLIIPKRELRHWEEQGWAEEPGYRNFHYLPEEDETVILGKPPTLAEVGTEYILGRTIVGFSPFYGSIGMAGPGFLGIQFADEALVYGVWASHGYAIINDRVLESRPEDYDQYHPWMTTYPTKNLPPVNDLIPVIIGHQVAEVSLSDDACVLRTTRDGEWLTIELVKNDHRLAPNFVGKKNDAFRTGVIGDHIVIQEKNAVLWAY